MVILTDLGLLTSVTLNVDVSLQGVGLLSSVAADVETPILLESPPLTSVSLAVGAPIFCGLGVLGQNNRSYATYPFEFKVYPPPTLHSLHTGWEIIHPPPITLTSVVHVADTNFNTRGPITLLSYQLFGDALGLVPRREYPFEFDVEPQVLKIPYLFSFGILKKAASADITYDIVIVPKTRYTYESWTYNILLTDKPYVSYEFAFSTANLRVYGDFTFDVGEPITSYDFSFNVASEVRSTFDFEWDIIETWVPVNLPCTADPVRPGVVPPSAKKHRLNIRVYAGAILVGAGYATYAWAGPDDAQIRFTIADIPQLSAEHRVVIYDDTKKVYDRTLPYSEFWSDSYGNT